MMNFQIINNSNINDGKYYPNYDSLLLNAEDTEQKEYIQWCKENNLSFVYNMVYITRQNCGHYEIFQCPQNEYYPLAEVLKRIETEEIRRKCTSCILKI